MMNIQSLTILFLRHATRLALVAVALARCAFLFIPVRAVVADRATLPCRAVFANKMFFVPRRPMFFTAKMAGSFDRADSPGLTSNSLATKSTTCFNSWRGKVWVSLISHMDRAPFIPTVLSAKKVFVALDMRWISDDFHATLRTVHLYICTLVGGCINSGLRFLPGAIAFRTAEVTLLSLGMITLTHKSRTAPVANDLLVRAVLLALPVAIVLFVSIYRTCFAQNFLTARVAPNRYFLLPVRIAFSQMCNFLVGNMAIAVAIVLLVKFQYRRHSLNGFAAIRALYKHSVSAHKKTSYWLTDALAEGAPVAVGGQRIITGYKHPVNDGCALSTPIIA